MPMRELVKTYKSLCKELVLCKETFRQVLRACSEEGFHHYSRTAEKGFFSESGHTYSLR